MRKVTSTRGRPSIASGKTSKPLTRLDEASQVGRQPMSAKSLSKIVAAGAHGRRAPEVDDDALRPVAMVLGVAGQDLLGRAPPDLPGVAGRRRARIDGVEVAPGRQHVETAARRRAGRSGGDEASAERPQQAERFGRAAGGDALADSFSLREKVADNVGRMRIGERCAGDGVRPPHPRPLPREGAKPSALSGERPNTCRPSPIAHVLEVAEPGVEGDQRFLRRLAIGRAFLEQPALAPPLEDQRGDGARAARIEPLRLGEFVEQPLELERGPMRSGGDQRRRQVADRRRADAALGLRRLARIVDDERIDDRRRAEQDFGRASSR